MIFKSQNHKTITEALSKRQERSCISFMQASKEPNFENLQQFKKQSMEKHSKTIEEALYNFFIRENSLDSRLQLLSLIMENIVYVIIINGISFTQILQVFVDGRIIFFSLILLCILKFTCGIAFRFGISLIVLQLNFSNPNPWLIPNCLLLFILTVSQFLSSIAFNYSSFSMQVESRIYNKAIRHFLLMGNTIYLTLGQTTNYIHLISAVLFLLLLWSKQRSLMKSEEYRAIALRFYLYAACEHLRLFLSTFFPTTNTLPAAALSFFISQSLFALLVYCRPTPNCHQLLAKQQHLRLAFLLLRYSHSNQYNQNLEEFTSLFVKETVEQSTVLCILNKSNGFLQSLLIAEVHAEGGRLFLAMQQLEKARSRLSKCDLLRRVMLIHTKQTLKARFFHYSSKVTIVHDEAWKSFLEFQQLLHKAASQHLQFNLYLKRTDIQLVKIKQLSFKLVSIHTELAQKFEETRTKFILSTELYFIFLVRVCGSYQKAQTLLNQQRLLEKYLQDDCLEQKMFIRLTMSEDSLIIDKVGFNARELLDYDRGDLQGQAIERFVFSAFRLPHQKLIKSFLNDSFDQSLLFQKKTFVLNGHGTYNFCKVMLRLGLREEGFCYEGYIQVLPTQLYDYDSFFVVNKEGIIQQCSGGLFQQQEGDRVALKVGQVLSGVIGGHMVRTTSKQLYENYDPILHLEGDNPCYFYAKRIGKRLNGSKEDTKEGTLKDLKEKTPPRQKRKWQSSDDFVDLTKIESQIKNKEISALFLITLLLILGLFGSSFLMIKSATVKYNNQSFAINNFITLLKYYNTSNKLHMSFTYLDLRENYNYSNTFFKLAMADTAIELQAHNENLKQFNMGKYRLPTFNTAISYQQSNYELVLMLAGEAQLYQKFSSDIFMKQTLLDQAKLLVNLHAVTASVDYRTSMFNLMTNFVQNDFYYETISLWVGLANVIVFIFLGIRIFWKLKQVEDYSLQKRCNGFDHEKKIKEIIQFMKEITIQEVPIDKMNKDLQIYQSSKNLDNNNTFMTEASLVKETSTIRTFVNIPSQTTKIEGGFIQDMQKDKDKTEYQQYNFIKTKSYRCLLVTFGLFILILILLIVGNQYYNNINQNVDEAASLNSVLTLYRSIGIYSPRCIIATLNSMLQKNQKGLDLSTSYIPVIKSCQAFMTTYTMPVFPEVQFSEFSNFSSNLNQLYQKPICTFLQCDPQYYDELNLIFINVFRKYALSLSPMFKATLNYTQSQMKTYLTINKRYIDLLFYTEMILRGYITDLIMSYLNSYNLFMNNVCNSKFNYAFCMIIISTLGLVMFVLFVWQIHREQKILLEINKIYWEPNQE